MSSLRVFLIRNVAPANYGGGEKYQVELGKALKESGFRPVIFTASEKLLDEAKKNEIECVRAPFLKQQNWSGWRNVLLPVYYLWQLRLKHWYKKQIRRYNPCVLNVQSRDEMIGATLAGISCNKTVIWTDHADFKNWVLWNVNVKCKNLIGKKIVKLSREVSKVIFVSERVEEETKKMIRPLSLCNTTVIRNGVVDEVAKYENVELEEDSFVFMGRVVEEKGIKELVEAFMMVLKKYPQIKLNVYGDGEKADYENLCKDYKEIRFYDWPSEPLEVLAENEIFVLPSYREGLSLSLLNATMMEKKIIASDVDGNQEVVVNGETGLLVPAKNAKKLAEAMIWMLDNKKQAEKMAKNARKKYEREYDFDKIFEEKILSLYNKGKE